MGPAAALALASAKREDLGSQAMENVTVKGERIFWPVPASASGTGQPVMVTDEYWYSEELHLNMLIRHNDPRASEQTSTIHPRQARGPRSTDIQDAIGLQGGG